MMNPKSIKLLQSLIIMLLLVSLLGMRPFDPAVPGTTINVTTTADNFGESANDSTCSLREAIQAANNDIAFGGCTPGSIGVDAIQLPAGTYYLTRNSGDNTNFEDSNVWGDLDLGLFMPDSPPLAVEAPDPIVPYTLTITGAGRDTTIIDGSQLDRVMDVHAAEEVLLQDLTIQHGLTPADTFVTILSGGGIFNRGALELDNVKVSNNACGHGNPGGFGGGIYNQASLVANEILLTDNQAGQGGSGISGGNGGGIYSGTGSNLSISHSTIANNYAGRTTDVFESTVFPAMAGNGGGIYFDGIGGSLSYSTIKHNFAGDDRYPTNAEMSYGGWGGGLFIGFSGSILIESSTISGNAAGASLNGFGGHGGGIYNYGDLTLLTSTISGNTTGGGSSLNLDGSGGGIYTFGLPGDMATLVIKNSTIANNNAGLNDTTAAGGGIYLYDAEWAGIIMLSSILANNTLRNNPALPSDCYGSLESQGWNLIRTVSGCTITGITTGNLTGVDPRLGPLTDNGGDTLTHYLYGGSPAIDAGDNDPLHCPTLDQRGVTRPQNGDNTGATTCDIGAYEAIFGELPASFFLPLIRK